jgi:hypothetical protein
MEKTSLPIMKEFTTYAKLVFNHELCTFLFLIFIFLGDGVLLCYAGWP